MSVAVRRRPGSGARVAGEVLHRRAGSAHALSLVATFAVLTVYGTRQWFFADEWEFIVRNLPGPARLGLFVPHNEHWSTIPLLVYRGLFGLVALHTYVPYVLLAICLHIVAAHLVWRLALRAGAERWLATAVTAVFLVLGVGYEQMITAFQFTFELSLVCGLGWLLVVDGVAQPARRVLLGWTLGVAASMSSGIAIPMIAVVALAAWGRRGVRSALVAVSVPAVSDVTWYVVVHPRQTLPASAHSLVQLPLFVARGVTATANGAVGLWWVGTALFAVLLGWMVRRRQTVPAIAWSGVMGTFILFTVVGYGRVSLGISQATSSRYLYLAAALLVPSVAIGLTALMDRRPRRQVAITAVVALCAAHGAVVLHSNIAAQTALRNRVRDTVMAAAEVVTSGAVLLGTQPDPVYDPDIDVTDLRTLISSGALPVTAPHDPGSVLAVEGNLEVSVSSAPAITGGPAARLRLLSGAGATPGVGGCTTLAAGPGGQVRFEVVFPGAAAISVTAPSTATATAALSTTDLPGLTAPLPDVAIAAGQPVYINVTAPHAVLSLTMPTGAMICGVGP